MQKLGAASGPSRPRSAAHRPVTRTSSFSERVRAVSMRALGLTDANPTPKPSSAAPGRLDAVAAAAPSDPTTADADAAAHPNLTRRMSPPPVVGGLGLSNERSPLQTLDEDRISSLTHNNSSPPPAPSPAVSPARACRASLDAHSAFLQIKSVPAAANLAPTEARIAFPVK
jgi:hypothetical protein